MKALIILNLEDCTFDEIDEAKIKEISLIYQDKETGKKCDFLWETGFKIVPMPQKKKLDEDLFLSQNFKLEYARFDGYNECIDEILGKFGEEE